jgi:T5orf172 domain
MAEKPSQIVYVLTNPAMPGLVKIGKTTQLEVEERMKQLYGTGVPVPFDCAFACQVKNAHEVERVLHFAFGNSRLNPNREFFRIESERVIEVLKLLKVDDITLQFEQQLEADVEAIDKQSAQNLKNKKRPRMNFHELDIPNGSILISKDGLEQATVVGAKEVNYRGVVCSLTSATRKLLSLPDDYALQPSPYWTFNGKTISEIYEAFHSSTEDA